MTSAVIGFGCLIKKLKFKEIKSRRKDWLENVIHSFSKTKLQLSYIYIYIYIYIYSFLIGRL